MTRPNNARGPFAVGLILYNPEDSVFKRIDRILAFGLKVFIFDNSPFNVGSFKSTKNLPNTCYITSGKNVGIGFGLATICATAYSGGYQHLLCLDQDTGISEKTLEFIEAFCRNQPDETQDEYAAVTFSGAYAECTSILEVRLAINSGSLFNLSVLNQMGWHNHKYFVDCVDYEFCLRARRLGYKIGVVKNTPDFDHVTEQPDREIIIFNKKLLVRRYSKARIKDSIGAYLKLIIGGLVKNRPRDTMELIRSFGIYTFGQLISRLIKKDGK